MLWIGKTIFKAADCEYQKGKDPGVQNAALVRQQIIMKKMTGLLSF